MPFDLIPGLARVQPTDLFLHQTQKIGASCMVVLSVLFLFKALLIFLPRREAWFLALAYAFGTSALSLTSQAIWQHGPGQFFLSLGLWMTLKGAEEGDGEGPSPRAKYFALAGFAFAMAAWCRYTNILFFPGVLVYLILKQRRGLIPFLLGSLLPLMALGVDNVVHSGLPWSTGYPQKETEFSTPLIVGLPGVLWGPARGLWAYSPFLIFAFFGFFAEWKRTYGIFVKALLISALALILLISKYVAWPGGFCFGPRYFSDMDPLLVFACVPAVVLLKRKGWGEFGCLTVAFSLLVHFLGAYLTWKWEDEPLWAFARHPVGFFLLGGEGANLSARTAISLLTAFVIGLVAWIALRWAKAFRQKPV